MTPLKELIVRCINVLSYFENKQEGEEYNEFQE